MAKVQPCNGKGLGIEQGVLRVKTCTASLAELEASRLLLSS